MKSGRASRWTAVTALSLVMAACIPAGAALGSCKALTDDLLLAMQGRTELPTKPQNVNASLALTGSGFTVSWNLPSNRPASTYTGYRVHFTHEASGATKEYSRSTSTGRTSEYFAGCITDHHCTGTFDIWVILKNNCEIVENISDTISFTYEH